MARWTLLAPSAICVCPRCSPASALGIGWRAATSWSARLIGCGRSLSWLTPIEAVPAAAEEEATTAALWDRYGGTADRRDRVAVRAGALRPLDEILVGSRRSTCATRLAAASRAERGRRGADGRRCDRARPARRLLARTRARLLVAFCARAPSQWPRGSARRRRGEHCPCDPRSGDRDAALSAGRGPGVQRSGPRSQARCSPRAICSRRSGSRCRTLSVRSRITAGTYAALAALIVQPLGDVVVLVSASRSRPAEPAAPSA